MRWESYNIRAPPIHIIMKNYTFKSMVADDVAFALTKGKARLKDS